MASIAREELGHVELSWVMDDWASREQGKAASERLYEARMEALRKPERDVEASPSSEELVVKHSLKFALRE